jgi:hypothetical protein
MSIKTSIVKSIGWDAAIRDAKKHIERLRGNRGLRRKKDEGRNVAWAIARPQIRAATQCLRHYHNFKKSTHIVSPSDVEMCD